APGSAHGPPGEGRAVRCKAAAHCPRHQEEIASAGRVERRSVFMVRPRKETPTRRGVILLVVVALLTLFAVVGLSFFLYAEAAAPAARYSREAQAPGRPDVEPELLLAYFLGQFIYDVPDDGSGVYSALRGHSLARNLYGSMQPAANLVPFNGLGRLHADSP